MSAILSNFPGFPPKLLTGKMLTSYTSRYDLMKSLASSISWKLVWLAKEMEE
jgi:hypothetical protein